MSVTTLIQKFSLITLAALMLALVACSGEKTAPAPAPLTAPAPTPETREEPQVDANEKNSVYFSPIHNLEEEQVRHFTQATESIDLAIYSFSSHRVRDLLRDKQAAGVKVRIVINKGSTDEGAQKFLAPIIELGGVVREVSTIMHHKFSIVDRKHLANSSANMGRTKNYDENLILCTQCPLKLAAFQNEFDALITLSNPIVGENTNLPLPDTKANLPAHQNYADVVLFTTSNFVPKFSPTTKRISLVANYLENGIGRVDSVLIDAISKARTSIKIASGHFRSKPLHDAIAAALARGVEVSMVLDGQEYISERNQQKQDSEIAQCKLTKPEWDCYKTGSYFSRQLSAAGAQVYLKYYSYRWHAPYSLQMHHKYMIVDGQTLYTGSYNWSYNAEYKTAENVAIYSGESAVELIRAFENNFEYLKNYGGGPSALNQRIQSIENAAEPIPLHFEPITLNPLQVDQLLEAAKKKCPTMYNRGPEARVCP